MIQRVACFTGRFQPFHNQHMEVLSALSQEFDRIIIGITNPDLAKLQEHEASPHRHTDSANPFSYESRVKIIENSLVDLSQLESNNVKFEIIPFDLTAPESWKVPAETVFAVRIFSPWETSKLALFTDQGFETLELPAPVKKLSASDIRQSLAVDDNNWKSFVAMSATDTIQAQWNQSLPIKVDA
jgi:nicotinamide-nucleotide adenylyltransferase